MSNTESWAARKLSRINENKLILNVPVKNPVASRKIIVVSGKLFPMGIFFVCMCVNISIHGVFHTRTHAVVAAGQYLQGGEYTPDGVCVCIMLCYIYIYIYFICIYIYMFIYIYIYIYIYMYILNV